MQLTSCFRLPFGRPQHHLSLQLRRYNTVVAFEGSSDIARPASESARTPQRQSRLQRQEASAWPAVDFSRLHNQVCTIKQSPYEETQHVQRRQHNLSVPDVAVPFSTCATARQSLHTDPAGRIPFGHTCAMTIQLMQYAILPHCRNLCLHLTGAAYIQMPAGPWL